MKMPARFFKYLFVLFLKRRYLVDPFLMPSAFEIGVDKQVDHVACKPRADDSSSEAESVGVVVHSREPCAERI